MQRPRRTAEFYEEPGTATKRRSRQQPQQLPNRSPAPGTAQKYGTRQSRIARPTSLDRGVVSSSLMAPASAVRNRQTPQMKTPSSNSKLATTRVLFTAEKQRIGAVSAVSATALHNDKKWVQEKMQSVTEYLMQPAVIGAIGFQHNFFDRANALRQISIKQFVSIVNHFIQLAAGNRFTVGSNHVEDIINILQKLNYPYQINKSWLKTPNTQHSFGNVIVLFDFLMDFALASSDEEQYELEEPRDMTNNSLLEEELLSVPNAKPGFALWDKQLDEEFRNLQQKDCDELILKHCGLNGTEAVNIELKRLESLIEELRSQRPQICKDDEAQYLHLEEEIDQINQEMGKQIDLLDTNENQIMQMRAKEKDKNAQISRITKEVDILLMTVEKQMLTVEQRDKLIEESAQLKHMLQSEDRTLTELRNRNYQQQVLLSRIKKELTDKIEKFNAHIRQITYSHAELLGQMSSKKSLQLPLNPQENDLKHSLTFLRKLRAKTLTQMKDDLKQQRELEQQLSTITHEISSKLEPETNTLSEVLTAAQKTMQNFEQEANKTRLDLDQKLEFLIQATEKNAMEILMYRALLKDKEKELKQLKQENERITTEAENAFNAYADDREDFLNEYSAFLVEANGELQSLKLIVNENSEKIQKESHEDEQI